MLQDIAPYKLKTEFNPLPPKDASYVCVCSHDSLLTIIAGDCLELPRLKDLQTLTPVSEDQLIFLFSIDDESFFLLAGSHLPETGNFKYLDTNSLRTCEPAVTVFAAALSIQLNRWYQKNRFCGCCGTPSKRHHEERALICESCGQIVYPYLAPSVIVGLIDGERILLTKYADRPYTRYALVAGYVEFGETLEETVCREVMEEVGLKVKHIRYYKSQPWPFSDSLLVGFFADLDGDDKVTLEEKELSEATWFHRDQIPGTLGTISLTNEMIEAFRNHEIPV